MWWIQVWNGFAWVTMADAFNVDIGFTKWKKHYSRHHKYGRLYNSMDGKVHNLVQLGAPV